MIFRRLLAPLALAVSLAVLCAPACKSSAGQRQTESATPVAAPTVEIDTGERKVSFRVELARSEPELEKGLMYRERLAPETGMLFLFPRESVQTFWMKNTLIPLDMIFISADHKIAGIVHDAEPQTLTVRSVAEPSQYVLEIGGGLSARLGLRAGATVTFHGVD
ncbi:MAG TPA: DUF192 domain-containing protein [Polyangia bacterium]|nr:DUF192 domain-containing protein [Polyangia bacterium]